MNLFLKIIACFSIPCTLFACEQKADAGSTKESKVEEVTPAQEKKKKLTPFEMEIQKMLVGKKADEAILKKFLRGKPKEMNGDFVKQGLDYYVAQHGERPGKRGLIKALHTLNLLNVEMRNEEALERIKQKLADQLKKEQKQ